MFRVFEGGCLYLLLVGWVVGWGGVGWVVG